MSSAAPRSAAVETFDDHLGLAQLELTDHRLLVFVGASGSGKSTAIRWLLDRHPSFTGRQALWLDRPPFSPPRGTTGDLVVVDDLLRPSELVRSLALLRTFRTLLVASHLGPGWFRPLLAVIPGAAFRTDRDPAKIARYLARCGVPASDRAVRRFVSTFGATYTDVDLVLERCPAASFDVSLARFLRFCRVEQRAAR